MTDEFDVNCPHGHLAKWGDFTYPARILATDLPGDLTIAAVIEVGVDGYLVRVHADGTLGNIRLINASAPVKHAEVWVNVYRGEQPYFGVRTFASRDDAQMGQNNLIGSIRISTADSEIIDLDGRPVTL